MTVDHEQLKERMRAMWCEGDWPAIAARLEDAARALVERCCVGPGDKVLDVAAGNGNAAVWAARAGARVVATDLSPLLVEQGRRRCAAEGLDVEWREADMEDLPFADETFDSVLSAFGISFAPRPRVALEEIFRVTRPGGCIGLAKWAQDGWPARMGAIIASHLRPQWGSAEPPAPDMAGSVARWMLDHAAEVRTEPGVVWQHFDSPEEWWEHWDASAPQMALARRTLSDDQYCRLREELVASVAVAAADTGDGTACRWASQYLLLTATKRAAEKVERAARLSTAEASAARWIDGSAVS